MIELIYEYKILISIIVILLIIVNITAYYYYYGFTKEEKKKDEQKKDEQKKEEQKKEEQKKEEVDNTKEVKSSIEYMIYEYKVYLFLIVLIFLTTIVGLYYYNYENEISKYILIILIILIIFTSIISIIYYYYYNNDNDKEETVENIDSGIIKSLEEGHIEERKKVLLNYLDKKFDYQGVPTGIFYLKQIKDEKRIELYENIELKYIEKISIGFNSDNENKYLDEILNTLTPEDETLLYTKLRGKNIFLYTERDIIGSKLKKIIKLLDENKNKTIKEVVSILCFDSYKDILIEELKKRNIFNKIVSYLNNENYGNISCKNELLK